MRSHIKCNLLIKYLFDYLLTNSINQSGTKNNHQRLETSTKPAKPQQEGRRQVQISYMSERTGRVKKKDPKKDKTSNFTNPLLNQTDVDYIESSAQLDTFQLIEAEKDDSVPGAVVSVINDGKCVIASSHFTTELLQQISYVQ